MNMKLPTQLSPTLEHTFTQSKTYKPSGFWAVLLLFGSIGFMLAGALCIWFFGIHQARQRQPGDAVLVAITGAFMLLGAYMVAELFTSRIVLSSDIIEIQHLTSTKTLRRSELEGWRVIPTSPPTIVLVPKDAATKKVKIANLYRFDDSLDSWLEPLPNLDFEDRRRIEGEIRNNPELEFTESERGKGFRNAKRTARILNLGAAGVMLWAWIYPTPYRTLVLVLVLLPFLALVAIRKFPVMRIDQQRNDPRPSVGISFMLPGFTLMLRAFADVQLFSWGRASVLAISVASAVWLAAYIVDSSIPTRLVNALVVGLILLPYGFGSVLELNNILDRSTPTMYSAPVLSKRISRGSRHTDYRLHLGAWEGQPNGNWVSVPPSIFQSVIEGDLVCLPVRAGAFQIRWYSVTSCVR